MVGGTETTAESDLGTTSRPITKVRHQPLTYKPNEYTYFVRYSKNRNIKPTDHGRSFALRMATFQELGSRSSGFGFFLEL